MKIGHNINIFLLIDIDNCSPNPCQNDGECIDGIADFTCNCVEGFTGKKCGTSNILNIKMDYQIRSRKWVNTTIKMTLSLLLYFKISMIATPINVRMELPVLMALHHIPVNACLDIEERTAKRVRV